MRRVVAITLSDEERQALTRLSRSKTTSVRLAHRAQIVLLAARGLDNRQIAAELGIDPIAYSH